MKHSITTERGNLKASLLGRETVEEMLDFVRAVASENAQRRLGTILMDIRASRPIFHFAHGFLEEFVGLSPNLSFRIALLGDTIELRLSNDYLALLARQQGLNVRSFRSEVAALKWLSERRVPQERRSQAERREALAQREKSPPRRREQRRSSRENSRPLH